MADRQLDPRVVVGVVYVSAQFMSAMDTTIVNVALPTLSTRFHAPSSSIDAVVVGYLVSLAVVIPASGWLGDRFGTKRVFLFALALFSLASALCGLSNSVGELVAFRVAQGIGGGMLTPTGMAMLYRTFPPAQRVQASRILVIPTVIAPALAPVLGGFLIDNLSWRWVFFVNVPVGTAALIFGILFVQEHREPLAGRFDVWGFVLAGAGFGLAMYALTEAPAHGWGSPIILSTGIAGLIVLAGFVVVELRAAEPLVQLRLLQNRLFWTASLTSQTAGAGFFGILFLTPLFLQQGRGASALSSGLTTFPEAVGVVLSMQIVARFYPAVGPRRLMAGGLFTVTAFMLLLSVIGLQTSSWVIRILMFLVGAGMAYVFLPVQAAAFATISPALMGRASTLFNAQRQIGAALGVAILSSVLAIAGPTRTNAAGVALPHLAAYHDAFRVAAVLAFAAGIIALAVPDRDAAGTMRPRPGKGPSVAPRTAAKADTPAALFD